MCGIVGIFHHISGRPVPPLAPLLATLAHRGPDWQEAWSDGAFGFGMTRLAIIGGNEANQPLVDDSGRYRLVFNGEIYNYRELNQRHGLATTSDTRTLLELLIRHGPDALSQLCGMFALALYDRHEQSLLLARDRFGKKPLFLAQTPDGLAFASELKPLLALPGFQRELDLTRISEFLSMGYIAGNATPFRAITALPAASWRRITPRDTRQESYFFLREQTEDPTAEEEFLPRFRTAVRRRLVSDVPVGIFLSGGMDSSAVLATALQEAPGSIRRAFTITTPEKEDEAEPARHTCRSLGLPIEEVEIRPEMLPEQLPHMVAKADNLLANPPMLALDALSRQAGESFKVILSGGGGDELFYGYPTWKADWLYGGFRHTPPWARQTLLNLLQLRPANHTPHAWDYALRRLCTCPTSDPLSAHAWWRTLLAGEELEALGRHWPQRWDRPYQEAFREAETLFHDPIRRIAHADLRVWWQHMGLYMADVIPMGRGVELRAPFMDHELVEWTLRVPRHRLYHPLKSKPLLKAKLASLVPPWVSQAPKRPFAIPLARWFAGPLRDYLHQSLSPERLQRQGLLDPAGVQTLLEAHHQRREDNSFKLFALLVLTLWYDEVFKANHD